MDQAQTTTGPAAATEREPFAAIDYQRLALRGHALRAQALAGAAQAAGSYLGRHLIAPLRRRRLARARYRDLMAMDDHTLKDIGISRSDIRAIASGVWASPPGGAEQRAEPRIRCVVDNGIRPQHRERRSAAQPPLAA